MDYCDRCFVDQKIYKWTAQFEGGWTPNEVKLGDGLCPTCYQQVAADYQVKRLQKIGHSLLDFTKEFNRISDRFPDCPSVDVFRTFYSSLLQAVDGADSLTQDRQLRFQIMGDEYLKVQAKLIKMIERHPCDVTNFLLDYLFDLEKTYPRID